jgi:hypothetical protein
MSSQSEIREALTLFIKNLMHASTLQAEVLSVDEVNRTCDVLIQKQKVKAFDVRLQAVAEDLVDKGIVCIPKVGSIVQVSLIDGIDTMLFVSQFSTLTKVIIEIDSQKLEITANGFAFNGGNLGGLIKIQQLLDSLDSIKTYCTDMKTAVSNALTAVGVGTAASGPSGATSFNTAMASKAIQIESMEDTKVKH